ncbi:MAG: PLP-dependent aminotransferase family protein, partial [Spirochaetales bacterium]
LALGAGGIPDSSQEKGPKKCRLSLKFPVYFLPLSLRKEASIIAYMNQFTHLLASRTSHMSSSAIREILKLLSTPGMISLAGGIPATESFPLDSMEELVHRVLEKYGGQALQYGLTEGFPPLREALVTLLAGQGIKAKAPEVLIATGSQGVLDGIAKLLISPGDAIAVEAPTYLGAIQAFNPYEPRYLRIATDAEGVIPESLQEVLKHNTVKFVYLVPTFQNPSGKTLSLKRRAQVAEIIQKYNTLLVEDDPYSLLRYQGNPLPPIYTMAPTHTLYTSTLSKVFAPGLRIGFFLAPPPLDRWLVLAKQGVDLHTSTFTQALGAEYITGGYLARQLPKIIALYAPRQRAMLQAMETYFPSSFTWIKPDGGMFIWAEGPEGLDMEQVYYRAVERKVAYVPGKYFYTEPGEGLATLRLNFTCVDPSKLEEAIGILGEVFQEALASL